MSLDFLDRLREGSFVSPETTTVQSFLTDTVTKRGGKKISTLELLNSNESVSQDHGNLTDRFPLAIYFTGDDHDIQVTDFEKLLKEHYTQDFPGYLRHPLWGDIDVFPISWTPVTELVRDVGVSGLEVEFIEVFPRKYPESALDSSDIASKNLDDMSALDQAANMITTTVAAAKNIKDKIEAVVDVINAAVEFVETIEDIATDIQNEINSLIDDVAGNITQLLFATQRLMRLPGRIVDETMNKINTYKDMCTDIINAILGETGGGAGGGATEEINADNRKNNAVMMETFAGFAVGCLSESAAYTEFDVRTDTIASVDIIIEALDDYNTAMATIRSDGDDIEKEYSGGHNFQSLLTDTTARINDLLLTKTFDLKAEKKFKLKTKSDPLTLCYEYYGNVEIETLEYFNKTNNVKHDEFLEIPSGREVVIYI